MIGKALSGITASRADRHSLLEDGQGILAGAMLATLGVVFLAKAGLLTGGTAGLAFLLHYGTGFGFGPIFFALNLPFYILAFRRFGAGFTVKTFLAVFLTSLFAEALPRAIDIAWLDPLVAAVFGGLLLGAGMLALFRHRASLGGFGILALYIQDSLGWRAGLVQLGFDAAVLSLSFLVASPFVILCSVIAAAVLNLTLAINHRRDRYIAV